jgi:hypothetical protein
MTPSIEDKVKALSEKLAKAKKLMRQKQARQNASTIKQARKDDARRKIIVGGYIIKQWGDKYPSEFLSSLSEKDKKIFIIQPVVPPSHD